MKVIFCDIGDSSDIYVETTNLRSFGMASFLANIGGYVGIILGISFLSVPDIACRVFKYIRRDQDVMLIYNVESSTVSSKRKPNAINDR